MFAAEDGGQNWTPVSGNLEENPDGTGSGPSVRWQTVDEAARNPSSKAPGRIGDARQSKYLVDDEFADKEGGHGEKGPDESQHEREHREGRAGQPDQLQEWRQIPEGADALAPRFLLRRWHTARARPRRRRAGAQFIVFRHSRFLIRMSRGYSSR